MSREFTKIYEVYFPKLIRFSRFYIGSEEDAENIVQDTFAYLWEHSDVLTPIQNLDAFLFTVVKNRCMDFLRRQVEEKKKEQNIQDVVGMEYQLKLYSLQQLDETRLGIEEVEALLMEAVGKLPKRCQEIFILSRKEGYKHREIAERLNITVSTVESQMNIAIRRIKSELKDYLPFLLFLL